MADVPEIPARPPSGPHGQFLCLTICGYRRPGMSEGDYRHHMTEVSAPMTKELMVKYGVKRWTMVGVPTSLTVADNVLCSAAPKTSNSGSTS